MATHESSGDADVAFGLGYADCQPIIGDWLGRDAVVQSPGLSGLRSPVSSKTIATDVV